LPVVYWHFHAGSSVQTVLDRSATSAIGTTSARLSRGRTTDLGDIGSFARRDRQHRPSDIGADAANVASMSRRCRDIDRDFGHVTCRMFRCRRYRGTASISFLHGFMMKILERGGQTQAATSARHGRHCDSHPARNPSRNRWESMGARTRGVNSTQK
jgi:hypothetical protein